jgi:hypothetical protein
LSEVDHSSLLGICLGKAFALVIQKLIFPLSSNKAAKKLSLSQDQAKRMHCDTEKAWSKQDHPGFRHPG